MQLVTFHSRNIILISVMLLSHHILYLPRYHMLYRYIVSKQLQNMKLMLSCSVNNDRLMNYITSLCKELTLLSLI